MSKSFLAWLAVIVIALGAIFYVSNRHQTAAPAAKPSQHIEGSPSSGVRLVEYGDFQCPACEDYEPVVEQITAKYLNRIQFQFRNFPLTSLHPNAFAAARAAEAAGMQNKYWQMHDALYATQDYYQWAYVNGNVSGADPTPYFQQYAKNLGLNLAKFNTDSASSAVNNTIQADIAAGTKLGVSGTPTFFLDGRQVANAPQDINGWSKLIDAAIAAHAAKR